jgi:hypothetical protein
MGVPQWRHDIMSKRPSLFAAKSASVAAGSEIADPAPMADVTTTSRRPPSREGKRVLSIYLDPLAWKQLRQLALDTETSTQALGEEAVNLLFAKHGINRSA